MFKKLIKEMEKLQNQRVAVPIQTDADGYLDKECPSKECLFLFKVHGEDWSNLFRDEAVFCPQCGHEANSDSWWTTEQLEKAKEEAFNHVKAKINNALVAGAREFNSRNSGGFLTLKMKVSEGTYRKIMLPISAREEMEQKITCTHCEARYSVVGVAYFCPCCGNNSAEQMFDQSIEKVRCKINNLEQIKKALTEAGQKDEAIITIQSLLETSLSDCVTALQRYSEKKYILSGGTEKTTPNAFQRLEFADETWRKLFGEGYRQWLTEQEYHQLNVYFQRRHLLQHCEGIVDEKYLNKTNDVAYKAGQRIVVGKDDVLVLLDSVAKIVSKIREAAIQQRKYAD